MLGFKTQGFNGYAANYSPFFNDKIAVGTASNYGLVGNGKLFILGISPEGRMVCEGQFDTQDGIFDVAWSEQHENHVATACGDGSVKLFDIKAGAFPLVSFKEHTREVFSVNWNMANKSLFCTSSWDSTIKIWTPERTNSVMTLGQPAPAQGTNASAHIGRQQMAPNQAAAQECIYSAKFSPHTDSIIASAHSTGMVKVWDTRAPQPLQQQFSTQQTESGGPPEVLSLDWNKYRPTVIATGGVDRSVQVYDIRMTQPAASQPVQPLSLILGHRLPVRGVSWSPHHADLLLSCSYDMTARVWRDASAGGNYLARQRGGMEVKCMDRHTEFVIGGDWSLWGDPGWITTVGWDQMVYVWHA